MSDLKREYWDVIQKILLVGRETFPPGGYDRIVFTNGCFDVLHVGHASVLSYAKDVAGPRGAVVVGINSDESVRRLKGEGRPVNDEERRATLLMHLRSVDFVVTFDEDTPYELIKAIDPDVIVKGGDYKKEDVVGADISLVLIAPLVEGVSTTRIMEKLNSGT